MIKRRKNISSLTYLQKAQEARYFHILTTFRKIHKAISQQPNKILQINWNDIRKAIVKGFQKCKFYFRKTDVSFIGYFFTYLPGVPCLFFFLKF